MQKKAAIELSMTTVVIVVLAMTMLILGLVLIRTIFTGATYNVETINEKVRGEINKLFTEAAQKLVVYLPENLAKIKQGQSFGVAFGIRNIEPTQKEFNYVVSASSDSGNCPPGTLPMSWIIVGKTGSSALPPGDTYTPIIRFQPPLTAPLCITRFKISVTGTGITGFDGDFDVQILPK
jgi:hypothetical protein